jgi:hypothetical protein
MPRRVMHIAQGVKDLNKAIDFYSTLFYDIEPVIGEVELGTGRKVNGAYWRSDYVYFYVFKGHELSDVEGIDHLGIQFFDKDDLQETRNRMFNKFHADEIQAPGPAESELGRWFLAPEDVMVWELFPNVFEENK